METIRGSVDLWNTIWQKNTFAKDLALGEKESRKKLKGNRERRDGKAGHSTRGLAPGGNLSSFIRGCLSREGGAMGCGDIRGLKSYMPQRSLKLDSGEGTETG